jgi:hypothetical protein
LLSCSFDEPPLSPRGVLVPLGLPEPLPLPPALLQLGGA